MKGIVLAGGTGSLVPVVQHRQNRQIACLEEMSDSCDGQYLPSRLDGADRWS